MNLKETAGIYHQIISLHKKNDNKWFQYLDNWYNDKDFKNSNSYIKWNDNEQYDNTSSSNINIPEHTPCYLVEDKIWPNELSVIDLSKYLRSKYK